MTQILTADTRSLDDLAKRLRSSQADVYRALQKQLRQVAAGTLVPAAKANAAWSAKIAPTIRARVSGTRVVVTAGPVLDEKGKPTGLAAWYENGRTSNGPWRHPVFGGRGTKRPNAPWAYQPNPHRPFLAPALEQCESTVTDQLTGAVVDALKTNLEEGR